MLGSALLWDKLVRSERQLAENRIIKAPFDPTRKITFHEDFIIMNDEDQTRVYSSHCTHLGCVINQAKDDQVLCPCHGSAFDRQGVPVNGPAIRPLEKLPFNIDKDQQQITIEL